MTIFECTQPEELLQFLRNFNKSIERTCTMNAAKRIDYLNNLLSGSVLQNFYKITRKNTVTTNTHLKEIHKGLLQ